MKKKNSKIYFEEVAAGDLVKKYGTPLYVYEANRIRENYQRLYKAFQSKWPNFKIYYAIKSNSNPHVAKVLIDEGAGLDCASQNEILLARKLGVTGNEVIFSGNYLSVDDIKEGLKSKILFNLDDTSLLPKMLKEGKPETLIFRINPAVGKSNVHESDVLAGEQSKFGIPWEKAEEAYAKAVEAGIQKFGVHMMTGSCVTDEKYFAEVTSKLLDCVGPISKKLNIQFDFIDIGGGFGIPYEEGEKGLDIDKTATLVTDVFKAKIKEYGLDNPRLCVEPARYFVGDAGYVVGRVHAVKESYKKFVGTDVGMSVLARPIIYGAYHGIHTEKEGPIETVTVTGQACENADAWAKDRDLPKLEVGDLIVVENAGGYGYVMSYPYNGRLRAAEVLVDGKEEKLIRRRETFEDWIGPTSF